MQFIWATDIFKIMETLTLKPGKSILITAESGGISNNLPVNKDTLKRVRGYAARICDFLPDLRGGDPELVDKVDSDFRAEALELVPLIREEGIWESVVRRNIVEEYQSGRNPMTAQKANDRAEILIDYLQKAVPKKQD